MSKPLAKTRLTKLKAQLAEIDYAYYVLDKPQVSDAVRDSLKDEVEAIEKQFPDLVTPDSPTQRIGGKALGKFKKVKHNIPKWSLDDVFDFDEVREFDARVKRFLKIPSTEKIEYTCELKIDGLNMSFHYEKGAFQRAVTRGDGVMGEDVTHTVKTIKSLPLQLRRPLDLEFGGEVYLPIKSFQQLNKAGLNFANPRNAAAGTVRQLDPAVASSRDLNYLAWTIYSGVNLKTQAEMQDEMKALGLRVSPYNKVVQGIEAVISFCQSWTDKRQTLPFEIDGVAIKINRMDWQNRLGRAAKYVRWACAYKFPAEQATSIVEDVVWQVGRTGALTPVAHLKPVRIAGSTVSRATLHNLDELERKDVRIGDTVILHKAGDIIPEILESLVKMRTGREKKVEPPKTCPICHSKVVRQEGLVAIICVNKKCFAQEAERFIHFVSRKGFDIDGLGEKVVELLLQEGLISTFADIFKLTEGDLKPLERFAEKSAVNLIQAIQTSKHISLGKLLYALGIKYVGEETAALLASHYPTRTLSDFIKKMQSENQQSLENIEGIGPKVAEAIIAYFQSGETKAELLELEGLGLSLTKAETIKNKANITGKTFVLTGTMEAMSREEAKSKLKLLGAKVAGSVSAKTDYVVAGHDPGSKLDNAKKLNVPILQEQDFLKLLNT